MKRVAAATILMFMLCSSALLINIGTTRAGNPNYSIVEYIVANTATVDGKWTTSDEWTDTPATPMGGNATGMFGYNIQSFTTYGLEWIIEIFTDNTDDPGDYFEICLDDQNGGGTAPQPGDYMIRIIGHNTLKVYEGTGTGWREVTPAAGELTWSNTISASPWNSTQHWILEIVDSSKTAGTVQVPNAPPTGMRIAAYDARTGTLAAWPPNSSADIPDTWGVIATFSMEPIPENLKIAATMMLTTFTVAASTYLLRKNGRNKMRL